MKSTEAFKATIKEHLEKKALEDPLFSERFHKEGKNIDDCITYILNTVQKSGCNGFADDEIFGMAIHYYDEDKIDIGGSRFGANVVVNHVVELTEEEKKQAREKARKIFEDQQLQEIKKEEQQRAEKEKKQQERQRAREEKRQAEREKRIAMAQQTLF